MEHQTVVKLSYEVWLARAHSGKPQVTAQSNLAFKVKTPIASTNPLTSCLILCTVGISCLIKSKEGLSDHRLVRIIKICYSYTALLCQ